MIRACTGLVVPCVDLFTCYVVEVCVSLGNRGSNWGAVSGGRLYVPCGWVPWFAWEVLLLREFHRPVSYTQNRVEWAWLSEMVLAWVAQVAHRHLGFP